MDIHQASAHYQPEADRLLLRVSTRGGQLYELWLTRRLMLQLWPHLGGMVTRAQLQLAHPQAVVMPQAREMVAQGLREQSLKNADFATPFEEKPREQPLGREPMLAVKVQLTTLPGGALRWAFSDAQRRELALQLPPALATALQELLAKALKQADWGFEAGPAAPPPAEGAAPPQRLLN